MATNRPENRAIRRSRRKKLAVRICICNILTTKCDELVTAAPVSDDSGRLTIHGDLVAHRTSISARNSYGCAAIDVTQARRLLRLTLLAPAVVEPLLANPDVAVNLESVLRRVMPLDWQAQGAVFAGA